MFALAVVFAVIPCALRGNHCKCHWPSFCFLIWICLYPFHFIVFQATPNLWKLQCAKIAGNPHWQFHRSGNPPSFICSHLFKPQVFTHLHMEIKQCKYLKCAHSTLCFPENVKKTPILWRSTISSYELAHQYHSRSEKVIQNKKPNSAFFTLLLKWLCYNSLLF